MLVRWRRLAQVDITEMQADTAIVELSRAVQLLLDEDLELRRNCDWLRKALRYASETNTNLTILLARARARLTTGVGGGRR